ncbi:MAG TPA: hypothetical protein PL015_07130 [Opitutaceae bacterium]|nr:hypothetical protein [Opitutaceae bacterium]HQL21717.1 hypothetical protein [Opitutaceae bacterium]
MKNDPGMRGLRGEAGGKFSLLSDYFIALTKGDYSGGEDIFDENGSMIFCLLINKTSPA